MNQLTDVENEALKPLSDLEIIELTMLKLATYFPKNNTNEDIHKNAAWGHLLAIYKSLETMEAK